MANKLLYIISKAPYSKAEGQEALEAVMVAASFEQDVSVLFLHDGVFQIKSHQHTESNGEIKEFTKAFRALGDFGVDKLYCLESSLNARGIELDHLIVKTDLLSETATSQLINQQNRVFTF